MLPFLATARQAKRSAFLFSANIQKTVDKHTFFCYNNKAFADMAQQVEHILGKDEVTGSNPVISSRKNPGLSTSRDFFTASRFCRDGRWT